MSMYSRSEVAYLDEAAKNRLQWHHNHCIRALGCSLTSPVSYDYNDYYDDFDDYEDDEDPNTEV